MMTDDMELVREYAAHQSEPAFETLVTRYVNLVYSTASRQVGDPHLAEEVTQAVFIILARKAGSLGPKTILPSWLHRAACYVAADAVKIQLRRARREQEAHMQSLLNEPQTEADDNWKQIAPLLDTALAGLSEKDHQAIVLRFFENKSLADVGQVLGANEDAARMRVNRALEKLRKFFTRRGIVSTTAIIAGAISANSVQAAPAVLAKSITAVAIAKGVAATGSTLTLATGALKLMAWTKAKTALVASAAVLLTATTATVVTKHFWQAHPSQHGKLKLPTGNVTPMMAVGFSHGIILASDGSLWAWGEEELGWPVLGLENIKNTTSLRRIGNDTDWASVAVGVSHNLAIKSDGSVWGWGQNLHYQLGDGTKTTRATPVRSVAGNDWTHAAAGTAHSFALKKDGSLWAWGNNWAGQLGIGTTTDSPKAVRVGSENNWIKIWAGGIQTVGLRSDGSLWFWGSITGTTKNEDKVLVPARVSPDTNWVDVCFGYFTVFAIKSDGTLWVWGNDAHFYTGSPAKRPNSSPAQIGTNSNWRASASSSGRRQIFVKKDGSLWELDASDDRSLMSASDDKLVQPKRIELEKDFAALAAGRGVAVALTRDGEVWTWGKVVGEHAPADFHGDVGQWRRLHPKILHKPWQLSNVDLADTSSK